MASSSLVRTLVGLVVQHDWFFESGDDEVLDPGDAVKQLERTVSRVLVVPMIVGAPGGV